MKKTLFLSILCLGIANATPFQSATIATAAELGANIAATQSQPEEEGTVINAMLEEDGEATEATSEDAAVEPFDPATLPRPSSRQTIGPTGSFPLD